MSHFAVAVATKDKNKIKEILAPYSEDIRVEPYIDETKEEIIAKAKQRKENILKKKEEGRELYEYELEYLNATTDEELYELSIYEDEEYDDEGNHLTTYNPDSKWDWYQIGGRYNNIVVVDKDNADVIKNGGFGLGMDLSNDVEGEPNLIRVNGAKIKDIHFDKMGGDYDKAIRYWELVVEEQEPKNSEEEEMVKYNIYKPEYYLEQYGTKEEYARQEAMFLTWAFVNEQGWCEQGKMGWWAMNDATKDSMLAFAEKFQEYINAPEHQDEYLIIVDCHI